MPVPVPHADKTTFRTAGYTRFHPPVNLRMERKNWEHTASAMLDERAGLQFGPGLPQLFLSVHHDRAVPCDGLLDRFAGNQQEANSVRSGLNRQFVSAIEQD